MGAFCTNKSLKSSTTQQLVQYFITDPSKLSNEHYKSMNDTGDSTSFVRRLKRNVPCWIPPESLWYHNKQSNAHQWINRITLATLDQATLRKLHQKQLCRTKYQNHVFWILTNHNKYPCNMTMSEICLDSVSSMQALIEYINDCRHTLNK